MSATTYAIHLRFKSPVHFGNVGLDYGKSEHTIHNDTIYAAIFNTLALIGQEDKIPSDGDSLGYALSSCLPYYFDGKQHVHFFPRPFSQSFTHIDDHLSGGSDGRKALKKISYLDKGHFFQLCEHGFLHPDISAINGAFYTDHNDFTADFRLFYSEVYPRVRVSRNEGEDAKPYYIERLFFFDSGDKYAGLFFLFYGTKEDLNLVKTALNILEDEGFGTDRKIGHGQFTYEVTPFDLPAFTGNSAVSLGLLSPPDRLWIKNHVATNNQCGYQLKRRGGWITSQGLSGFRKNDLQMFAPGSVFSLSTSSVTVEGVMHNVLPKSINVENKHPVWRAGKTMLFPLNLKP